MLLCLDVGNTHIYGGVFLEGKLLLRFRCMSRPGVTSDEVGSKFKAILRENSIDPTQVTKIAISSVVPSLDYSLRSACLKYFSITPFELHCQGSDLIQLGDDMDKLGADRVATLIGARHRYPNQNLLVIDLGTATTACVLDRDNCYRGGLIQAGMRLNMESLARQTAKLSDVSIVKPGKLFSLTTDEQIQSGLYYAQLASMVAARQSMQEELGITDFICIGTGGFAHLFQAENVFDVIESDLVLEGLCHVV